MKNRITAEDFFTGLFSALALGGWTTLSLRDELFDRASASAFQKLASLSVSRNLNVRFRILLHPFYGDSALVHDSVTNAVKRGLISLDNPVYQDMRLKLTRSEAEQYLAQLPGGAKLFKELVEEFLKTAGTQHERPQGISKTV